MNQRPLAATVSILGAVAAILPWFKVVEPLGLAEVPLIVAMVPLLLWGSGITSFKPWAVQAFGPVCVVTALVGLAGAVLVILGDGPGLLPIAAGTVALVAPVVAWSLWRR